jgi:DNA-binding GntR family transcriptional regulator
MDGDSAWALTPQRSLPEMVAERVVEAMRNGTLRPGERIVEATLAGKLGVSRGSLREALKALEADHLVESRRSHGTYVAQVTPARALKMITMRSVLEGLAARLVAARRDPETLRRLEEQHQRIRASARGGDANEWRDQDWMFHEMMCRAADNEFLLRAWLSIGNLVRLFLHQHPAFEQYSEHVLTNHDVLIAVLRSGDPDAAETTFRTVILRSGLQRLGLEPPAEFGSLLADAATALVASADTVAAHAAPADAVTGQVTPADTAATLVTPAGAVTAKAASASAASPSPTRAPQPQDARA